MKMAHEELTLLIKHLPSELTTKEQEDLLRHFGANTVKTMGNKGRMKHSAFATFKDHDAAKKAMKNLHQIEILGRRLVCEFSNNQQRKNHPTQIEAYKEPTERAKSEVKKAKPVVGTDEIDMKKVADNINAFARQWDVKYTLDPRLEYMYPQPTVSILTNIANALASVPKFYVQVLHLMNKMCLPAPFGIVTPTPVLPEGNTTVNGAKETHGKATTSLMPEQLRRREENGETSEESEIESEEEQNKADPSGPIPTLKKRKKKVPGIKPSKRIKLTQDLPPIQKPKVPAAKTSEVFEQPDVTGPKKIAFNLSRFENDSTTPQEVSLPTSDLKEQPILESSEVVPDIMKPLPGAPPLPPPEASEPSTDIDSNAPGDMYHTFPPGTVESNSISDNLPAPIAPTVETGGGFGKFEPAPPPKEDEKELSDEEFGESEFISSKTLRKGRISSSEKRALSVFKNYQKGEPSTRLYLKNIAKPVTQKDLHYIFGRYVDWNDEGHKNMFDIRLMKEGRMKGQAFVTLPTIPLACDALADTHGFLLQGKPIAVQFARSAKPKDDAPKKDEKKI